MACSVLVSLAGSCLVTKSLAVATAPRHVLVEWSTQVSITLEKPASLPPIVMLTSVVPGVSADTWPLIRSAVVAHGQATETKEDEAEATAHVYEVTLNGRCQHKVSRSVNSEATACADVRQIEI